MKRALRHKDGSGDFCAKPVEKITKSCYNEFSKSGFAEVAQMKKLLYTVLLIVVIVACLLVFFIPVPKGAYRDGGTKVYEAKLYKIVVWNRYYAETNEDGSFGDTQIYHKKSVFWFPDNLKSIDKLWRIEQSTWK